MMAEKQEHGKEDQPKPSKSQPTGPDSAEPELSELLASLAPSSGASDEPGGGGLHASSDEEPRHSLAGDSDAPGAEAKEAGQITPGSDEQDPIPAEDPLDDLVSAIDAEVGAQAFEDVTTADEAVQARQRDFKDDHIVFSLLGTSYAVPIGQVTDLEKLPALTTVPHVPDFVLGVANLRGDIISVLDLRTFLGFEQSERLDQGRVLIVKVGQDQTTSGLMVDEVQGIRSIPGGDIGAPAAPLEDKVSGLLRGVYQDEERNQLVNVMDLEKLFQSEEMQQLAAV